MKKSVIVVLLSIFLLAGFIDAQTNVGSSVSVNISSGETNDFTVIYDEFRSSGTTDFDSMSDQQLAALTEMVLNNASYGQIDFEASSSNRINLTEVHDNMIINLDKHLEFRQDYFFINNTYFTNLARNAEIRFYNVGYSNPRILRNGDICSICERISFDSGILIFNTSLSPIENSLFTLEETPPSGGGGGGGGSGRDPKEKPVNFTVTPEIIRLRMNPGEKRFSQVVVNNTGKPGIYIYQEPLIFDEWVNFYPYNFSVGPDHPLERVNIEFTVPEDQVPNVFTDTIYFRYNETEFRTVKIIYEIVDDAALFDLKSVLNENFLWNYQRLKPEITMINLGSLKDVDVSLEYVIKDYENNIIGKIGEEAFTITEKETIALPKLPLREYTKSGDYVFYTRLNYKGNYALASNDFSVKYFNIWIYLLILGIILGFAGIFLWLYDDDLRRFRRIIEIGEHYLKEKNLDNAKRKYKRLRRIFPYMNSLQRNVAKKESLEFYDKLVKELDDKK